MFQLLVHVYRFFYRMSTISIAILLILTIYLFYYVIVVTSFRTTSSTSTVNIDNTGYHYHRRQKTIIIGKITTGVRISINHNFNQKCQKQKGYYPHMIRTAMNNNEAKQKITVVNMIDITNGDGIDNQQQDDDDDDIIKEATTKTKKNVQQQKIISSHDINSLVERAIYIYEQQCEQRNRNNGNNNYHTKSNNNNNNTIQIIIGIAGCPGSGKSTIAEKVCHGINTYYYNDKKHQQQRKSSYQLAKVISMDGYHITKDELKMIGDKKIMIGDIATGVITDNNNMNEQKNYTTYDDLMKRRGAPWTFHINHFIHDLQKLVGYNDNRDNEQQKVQHHQQQQDDGIWFPQYCRNISDPLPNQTFISKLHDQIILVEGNYLLCWNESVDDNWLPLKDILHDTWFIDIPIYRITQRLIRRHLKNWTPIKETLFGIGSTGAYNKIQSSDMKNIHYIINDHNSKSYPTIIIR